MTTSPSHITASSFAHLLAGNEAPPDAVIPSIQNLIFHLKDRIDHLEAETNRLREERNILQTAIAPLRRLPPELIAEIFKACLPEDGILDQAARSQFMQLRCVSRLWRVVAFSATSLWSGLSVPAVEFGEGVITVEQVSGWFSRAGVWGLKLRLEGRTRVVIADDIAWQLVHLMDRHRNWVEFDFIVPSPDVRRTEAKLLSEIHRVTSSAWKHLQKLHLTFDDPTDNSAVWTFPVKDVPLEAIAPQLAELGILRRTYGEPTITISHPLVNHLTINVSPRATFASMLPIARQFPEIKILRISPTYELVRHGLQPREPYTNSNIESLELIGQVDPDDALKHLCLPSLQRLSAINTVIPIDKFASFFQKSACTITELEFTEASGGGGDTTTRLGAFYSRSRTTTTPNDSTERLGKLLWALPDLKRMKVQRAEFLRAHNAPPLPSIEEIYISEYPSSFNSDLVAIARYFERRKTRLPASTAAAAAAADSVVIGVHYRDAEVLTALPETLDTLEQLGVKVYVGEKRIRA